MKKAALHYKRFLLINDEAPQAGEANSGEGRLKPKVLFQISSVISLHLPNVLSYLKLKSGAQEGPSSAWNGLRQYQVPSLCPPAQAYNQTGGIAGLASQGPVSLSLWRC